MGGVGMQVNGYPSMGGASMSSPNGVGGMGGGGGFFGGAPSPSNQNWQHGGGGMMGMGGTYQYGHGQLAMGGQRFADPSRSTGQMGGTPAPPSAMQNMSPIGDGTGSGEYDLFNAYTNGQ